MSVVWKLSREFNQMGVRDAGHGAWSQHPRPIQCRPLVGTEDFFLDHDCRILEGSLLGNPAPIDGPIGVDRRHSAEFCGAIEILIHARFTEITWVKEGGRAIS